MDANYHSLVIKSWHKNGTLSGIEATIANITVVTMGTVYSNLLVKACAGNNLCI